ncbi:hypothetical protein J3D47_000210 [Pseudomonas laurylsulfativorans]|nr:hypothetical protein [Pseudomonas laurylsulfativorans]
MGGAFKQQVAVYRLYQCKTTTKRALEREWQRLTPLS